MDALTDRLNAALNDLYTVFRSYRVSDLSKTTCFDFGPSESELAGISRSIRQIPDETLSHMEFFGAEWNSWGTMEEVKYFLPRLLEYVARDEQRLANPGTFSLFKYKLRDFAHKEENVWSAAEKKALQGFFSVLLDHAFSSVVDVGLLLEAALAAGIEDSTIVSRWVSKDDFLVAQMASCLRHFSHQIGDKSHSPKGVYFDDPKRIAQLLDLRFSQMTEKEFQGLASHM